MRNFDTWNKYTDNNGNVLRGCVMFNVKDGNTQAPIFDENRTPLDNPILTDSYGRTEKQVFVDSDVTAYFYKYIGTGTYTTPTENESTDEATIDVHDDSLWSLQYTIDSVFDTSISVTGNAATAVPTISALRDINVNTVPLVDGVRVVTLLGYNSVGDKEQVNYVWDDTSVEQDDGGSVIKSYPSTGRWKLVKPTEHCDCRHFGIFPSNSTSNVTDNTLPILKWIGYCNTARIKPYFSANGDYVYYKYQQIYAVSNNEIDVAYGVQFEDPGSTNTWSTPRFNGDPLFRNANTKLVTNFAKASWKGNVISKLDTHERGLYVVDSALPDTSLILSQWDVEIEYPASGLILNNCYVKGSATVTDSSFTACEIDCLGVLGTNNSFGATTLKDEMFSNVSAVNTCYSCPVDIDDFRNNIPLYLDITGKQNQVDYDWQSIALNDNYDMVGSVVDADRIVSNYVYLGSDRAYMRESSTARVYTFINCKANMYIPGTDNAVYYFKNCEGSVMFNNYERDITVMIENSYITLDCTLTNGSVQAKDSSIVITGNKYVKSFSVKNCTLSCATFSADEFSSYSSILVGSGSITAKNCVVKDSQINIDIYSNEYKMDESQSFYTINCFFDNNIFNAQHHMEPTHSPTVVNGVWINNIGNVANPIVIDRTNMYADDTVHNYSYKGNTGTFPDGKGSFTLGTAYMSSYGVKSDGTTNYIYLVSYGYMLDSITPNTDPSIYLCTMNVFTIGTQNVKLKATFYPDGTAYGGTPAHYIATSLIGNSIVLDQNERPYDAGLGVGFPRSLTFDSGYSWKITRATHFLETNGIYDFTSYPTTCNVVVERI